MLDHLRLEPSGVPLYIQIRDQVLSAIGAGVIKPGQKMPTMRQVAVALKVDLNTVRHAYDALARAGAITVLPARGSFVTQTPRPTDRHALAAQVEALALRTIAITVAAGVDPKAVAERILVLVQQKGEDP
jgi:GntR family transcriptional regulator